MAEQIRLSLTVDAGVKKLIEDGAREYADDNVSAYVRGLAAFHALLEFKHTGRADIPGWILDLYPLSCIHAMREARDRWAAEQVAIHGGLSEEDVERMKEKASQKKPGKK